MVVSCGLQMGMALAQLLEIADISFRFSFRYALLPWRRMRYLESSAQRYKKVRGCSKAKLPRQDNVVPPLHGKSVSTGKRIALKTRFDAKIARKSERNFDNFSQVA